MHEDVGALEPVADLGAAGQRDGVVEPELAASARGSASSGPLPRIASRASGTFGVTSANARSSVAWSFCSIRRPTASASGASGGIPASAGVGSDGAAGSSSRP